MRNLLAAIALTLLTLAPGGASAQRAVPGYHPSTPSRPYVPQTAPGLGTGSYGSGYSGSAPNLGDTMGPVGGPGSSYSGGGGSSSSDYSYQPPPRPSPAEVWRKKFEFVAEYGEKITIGSKTSQIAVDMVRDNLDEPLRGRPLVIAYLHPDADRTDIQRLRESAGDLEVKLIKDPSKAYLEVLDIVRKAKKRDIIFVGHYDFVMGPGFMLQDRYDHMSDNISLYAIRKEAKEAGAWIFAIGCETGGDEATVGTMESFSTAEVVRALKDVAAATTRGGIIRAFAAQDIGFGISADNLIEDGLINIFRMSRIDSIDPRRVAMIAPPPPDLPKAFAAVVPGGCANYSGDARTDCDRIKTATDKLKPSPLRHWPWALGGIVVLVIGFAVFRRD